jgi:CPA1 family monovalent cation:H+ antiporter
MMLGAILRPTDPNAATSVLRRLGAPDRIPTILQGEALVNGDTGLSSQSPSSAAYADSGTPSLATLEGWQRWLRVRGAFPDRCVVILSR